MFTGIIKDVGRVRRIEQRGDTVYTIETSFPQDEIELGASIACNGVCLTVMEKGEGWFRVEASAETLSKTTMQQWKEGTEINLERSLRLGDELGGHLVYGHVDGTARVVSVTPEGDSQRWVFSLPSSLAPFAAPKGSIALNGVSLTVNEVDGTTFGVNLVPYTQRHTTFRTTREGDFLNVEIDILARYVSRIVQAREENA